MKFYHFPLLIQGLFLQFFNLIKFDHFQVQIQGLFLQFFNVIKFYHFPLLIEDLTLKFFKHNVKVLMCRSPVSHNLHLLFHIHRTPESRA